MSLKTFQNIFSCQKMQNHVGFRGTRNAERIPNALAVRNQDSYQGVCNKKESRNKERGTRNMRVPGNFTSRTMFLMARNMFPML